MEGKEPQEFWDALGGKAEYGSGKWLQEVVPTYPPRLFQCSNASGRFNVEEIFDFAQDVSSTSSYGYLANIDKLLTNCLMPPCKTE